MVDVRERLWLPDGKLLRGRGVIELFDERTGKCQHRESFENFISNETIKYTKWMVRRAFWTGIAGTRDVATGQVAGAANTGTYGSGTTQIGSMYRNPNAVLTHADVEPYYNLQHCAVWADTSAEDPTNEIYAVGPIVAYADKINYSGTDTLRGTVNQSECMCDATKTKWVFDWPTSAGNGTFQSVGWLSLNEATNAVSQQMRNESFFQAPSFGQSGTPYLGTNFPFDAYKATDDNPNDRIITLSYDAGGANHFRIRPISYAGVWGAQLFDVNTLGFGSSLGMGGIARAGTNLWMAEQSNSVNPCLRQVTMTGTLVSSLASTWGTLLGLTAGDQVMDIAWDGTYIWVTAGGNTVKTTVWQINPTTGAIISSFSVVPYLVRASTITIDPTGDLWVSDPTNNGIARFTPAGVFKASWAGSSQYTVGQFFGSFDSMFWRNSGGVNRLYSSNYNGPQVIQQIAFRALGARSRLSSAVTKANTQTMKVTYEFDYT